MPRPTCNGDFLVLKKTKLGEADLIITLLAEDGSLAKAVAKGARKPKNASSSRLEIFNSVHILLVKGSKLDIAKESRLLLSFPKLKTDPIYHACAACIAQVLLNVAQPELAVHNLFAMSIAALSACERADEKRLALLLGAYLIKLSALLGTRMSFSTCAICGRPLEISTVSEQCLFSISDGGAVCSACAHLSSTMPLPSPVIAWAQMLFSLTFEQILVMDIEGASAWEILDVLSTWFLEHFGVRMKALRDFATYSSL